MPQVCTVCTHPKANQINLAILRGEGSKSGIARRFSVTDDSIIRHTETHLADKVQRAQAAQAGREVIDFNAELEACFHFAKKLRAACDDWLADPSNSEAYTLDARANEISVIYQVPDGEKRNGDTRYKRHRDSLETLLKQASELTGGEILTVESKYADPRKLVLECADRLDKHLRMFGDLTGLFVKKVELSGQITITTDLVIAFHQQINAMIVSSGDPEQAALEIAKTLLLSGEEFAARLSEPVRQSQE